MHQLETQAALRPAQGRSRGSEPVDFPANSCESDPPSQWTSRNFDFILGSSLARHRQYRRVVFQRGFRREMGAGEAPVDRTRHVGTQEDRGTPPRLLRRPTMSPKSQGNDGADHCRSLNQSLNSLMTKVSCGGVRTEESGLRSELNFRSGPNPQADFSYRKMLSAEKYTRDHACQGGASGPTGACRSRGLPLRRIAKSKVEHVGPVGLHQRSGAAETVPWAYLRLPPFPQVAVRVLQLADNENVPLRQFCESNFL